MTSESQRVEDLRAAARYHRERRDLYRAKSYGPRATSPVKMRELEHAVVLAEDRLKWAERQAAASDASPPADAPCHADS